MLRTRILYVEDDGEIRAAMAQLLTLEGYDVSPVATAEDALRSLTSSRYDLVLTDYRLPAHNADWLLEQAKATRRLDHTPVIVLSAEARPAGIDGYRFFRKPVDLDVLLTELAEALEQHAEQLVPVAPSSASEPGTLELVLYVTGSSLKSQKAMRNLQRALRSQQLGTVNLTVCDVAEEPPGKYCNQLDEDHVLVTPTLVRRNPPPRVWIVGDLSDRDVLDEVLSAPSVAALRRV